MRRGKITVMVSIVDRDGDCNGHQNKGIGPNSFKQKRYSFVSIVQIWFGPREKSSEILPTHPPFG